MKSLFKFSTREEDINTEIAYLTNSIINGGYSPEEIVNIANGVRENVIKHLRDDSVRLGKELSAVEESLKKIN